MSPKPKRPVEDVYDDLDIRSGVEWAQEVASRLGAARAARAAALSVLDIELVMGQTIRDAQEEVISALQDESKLRHLTSEVQRLAEIVVRERKEHEKEQAKWNKEWVGMVDRAKAMERDLKRVRTNARVVEEYEALKVLFGFLAKFADYDDDDASQRFRLLELD